VDEYNKSVGGLSRRQDTEKLFKCDVTLAIESSIYADIFVSAKDQRLYMAVPVDRGVFSESIAANSKDEGDMGSVPELDALKRKPTPGDGKEHDVPDDDNGSISVFGTDGLMSPHFPTTPLPEPYYHELKTSEKITTTNNSYILEFKLVLLQESQKEFSGTEQVDFIQKLANTFLGRHCVAERDEQAASVVFRVRIQNLSGIRESESVRDHVLSVQFINEFGGSDYVRVYDVNIISPHASIAESEDSSLRRSAGEGSKVKGDEKSSESRSLAGTEFKGMSGDQSSVISIPDFEGRKQAMDRSLEENYINEIIKLKSKIKYLEISHSESLQILNEGHASEINRLSTLLVDNQAMMKKQTDADRALIESLQSKSAESYVFAMSEISKMQEKLSKSEAEVGTIREECYAKYAKEIDTLKEEKVSAVAKVCNVRFILCFQFLLHPALHRSPLLRRSVSKSV